MALKHNSKRTLDIIAGQKQRDATAAYKQIHPNTSHNAAKTNVAQLLAKPEAQIYLKAHVDKASETIVELMTTSEKDDIRLRAATDVLDRTHGKAIQQVNQTTTGVTLNIDLTSSLGSLSEPQETTIVN